MPEKNHRFFLQKNNNFFDGGGHAIFGTSAKLPAEPEDVGNRSLVGGLEHVLFSII